MCMVLTLGTHGMRASSSYSYIIHQLLEFYRQAYSSYIEDNY